MTSVCLGARSALWHIFAFRIALGMFSSIPALVSAHIWKTSAAVSRSTSSWSRILPRSRSRRFSPPKKPEWSSAMILRMTSGRLQATSLENSVRSRFTTSFVEEAASSATAWYVPLWYVLLPCATTTHRKNWSDLSAATPTAAFGKRIVRGSCLELVFVIRFRTSTPNASETSAALNVSGKPVNAEVSPFARQSASAFLSAAAPAGGPLSVSGGAAAVTTRESMDSRTCSLCLPWGPMPPTKARTSTRSPPTQAAASRATEKGATAAGAKPETSACATSSPCFSTTMRIRPLDRSKPLL
mmetsp:Transcript_23056/g.77855  ORF Transcript_23056/g.77855 Transcript_23056/m.77855 type:complete len:299 (-) Transcript_23056:220-1116(-)